MSRTPPKRQRVLPNYPLGYHIKFQPNRSNESWTDNVPKLSLPWHPKIATLAEGKQPLPRARADVSGSFHVAVLVRGPDRFRYQVEE